ncbi:IS66 family transposase [Acetobacter ascendens]|uniref:IS66 family transposase n=1 Tax=Acetobacter ascendens TaxID=481146 RepID=UPI000875ABAC|nr:IS66 family transposase [Acetobacter ascendens]AOW48573.1 transposase [Acetobacter ascendens]AOW48774.1 transposase [Acetobacter ascendens]AOW48946.1 transposase [Acetobacter ascendens]AOW49392.1 transposase [Acetobacter ascendens]AOW50683.1 transposase [Acetobacter ascendens]
MTHAPAVLPDDPDILREMIVSLQTEVARLSASARAYEALVQSLKIRIARLQKQKFGASSEKIDREIEQLELLLEDVKIAIAAADPSPDIREHDDSDGVVSSPRRRGKPKVSDTTPRERIVLDPGEACPACGGPLRLVGEDVTEILDFIAAKLKVVETARLKKSCRHCETMVQPEAPSRPVPRGMAGPGLLAHILVSKFDDHIPLYRQNEIFSRQGVEIPRSTLIDWCGQAVAVLRPLTDMIRQEVVGADLLHADDTPIQVLDPRLRHAGKPRGVKEGRIWTYLRDPRPWGGSDPPAVAYWFSPDRKGINPQTHLAQFRGILQADAYAGFRDLYKPDATGTVRVREAACWAHLRRAFHDVWKGSGSTIAREALEQIGELYDIERQITGHPARHRLAVRQEKSRPRVIAFHAWCEAQLTRIPGKGELAKAIRYALNRWAAFTLFVEDGRVAIDNNPAERAIRPVCVGRKNYLFAGSDAGGDNIADAMTLIESAKLSGINPHDYLADVLARINEHKINRLHELLPWNWQPLNTPHRQAA